jgi:apolipoprotein N-acyltransferase
MNLNKYTLIFLSVTGGILTGIAWTGWCTGLILLVAFVPFFIIENQIHENRKRYTPNAFLVYILPGLFIFSIIGIGWMRVASITGAMLVITGLSFLMAFSLWLGHLIRFRAGNAAGYISMLSFWLTYEYFSLNISIVSPWLNLGNGLSKDFIFIQWYEFTGTGGGTLWILLSNFLLARILIASSKHAKNTTLLIFWLSVVSIPIIYSLVRYNSIRENSREPQEVVILQPNTDPYSEKFVVPFKNQLQKVIKLASDSATKKTAWIITPETTVDDPVNLDSLNNDQYIKMIKEMNARFPNSSVVTGMVTFRQYGVKDNPPTRSAVKRDTSGYYSDHFNSALRIDTGILTEVYHKSKLVPGIEMRFFNGPGRLLGRILPYLGGTRWGYGLQEERAIFTQPETGIKVAPIICYESVFGSFVTDYVKKGANALFIITNDGWWKNTEGYRQHLSFASLRAIETRRPVARCGNTGVSCFIDIRGKRRLETKWWTEAVIKGYIIPEEKTTFYVKHGDYILRISLFISALILMYSFIVLPVRKNSKISAKRCNPGFRFLSL